MGLGNSFSIKNVLNKLGLPTFILNASILPTKSGGGMSRQNGSRRTGTNSGHEPSYMLLARTSGSTLNCVSYMDSKVPIHVNVSNDGS